MNMADSYWALFSASCRHSRRNGSMAAVGCSSDRVSGMRRVSCRGGARDPVMAVGLQSVTSSVRCWLWERRRCPALEPVWFVVPSCGPWS